MKIPDFIKFIRGQESQEYRLKNCSLVIDAHSFFYNSYECSHLPFVFGAEANEFARFINGRLLSRFKKANVKCFFIFKGGDTDIEKKIQVHQPLTLNLESRKFVSPVFLRDMFLQILDELGFKYSTCVNDSRDDCVALARHMQCPLKSRTTEYCFMKAPFIIIDKYKFPENYLICRRFELGNFLDKHSITMEKAAIFVALTDVHSFPEEYFNGLLQKWNVFDDDRGIKYNNLLKFLATHDEHETVTQVNQFLSSRNDIEKFNRRMEQILAYSQKEYKRSVVTDYLMNDCTLSVSRRDPLWFDKGVAAQHIAIPYINLYKHKYVRGYSTIKNNTRTVSLMLSIDIIKYAYNLLTNFKTHQIRVYQNSEDYITVSTEDLNIRKPMYSCHETVFENGWDSNIKRLKLFQHFLAENDIDVDVINKFPDDSTVLFIALTYFARKKIAEDMDVTKEIYCFVICYVMVYAVLYQRDYFLENRGLTRADAEEATRATDKYFKYDDEEATRIFDKDVLQTLIELQLCLLHMNYLNTLCGNQFLPTKYHRTFNGTFIYKLLHDMRDCSATHFVENLFKNAPSVLNFINRLIDNFKKQF